jgi:hypothetical protein
MDLNKIDVSEIYEELIWTDSVLESLEDSERYLADDVFRDVEDKYGKLPD